MKTLYTINETRQALIPYKYKQLIALIPTLGNLHDGHLSLIRKAKELAEVVVVSIFVNPLQFGPNEDFAAYPRTLAEDSAKLQDLEVDFLFIPDSEQLYPDINSQTKVTVPTLSDKYCGYFRPHFFYGVTTIVTKLFNIIQPDIAIFGEKDFQQLHIIKKMVADLCLPITIVSSPTIRESDGLAMSSRNQYLSPTERIAAGEIYQTLYAMQVALLNDEALDTIIAEGIMRLTQRFSVDYLCISNPHTLETAQETDQDFIILTAVRIANTRLIDNIIFSRS